MTDLERSLVLLGEELAFPATPDVSARVLARVAEPPGPRGRRRRALVLALAALAVALGAAMAVPPARTAILDLLRLRGASVQRVETLPAVPPRTARVLELGREATPAEVEEALVPSALGPPDAAYVAEEPYGRRVTLVYGPGGGIPSSPYTGIGLLVGEFRGRVDEGFLDKLATSDTTVERLQVGPYRALWLEGGPHVVMIEGESGSQEDRGRLTGNTLLVERGEVLVRIEGELDRERAIEIAASLE
jgi:hypothetical protein